MWKGRETWKGREMKGKGTHWKGVYIYIGRVERGAGQWHSQAGAH